MNAELLFPKGNLPDWQISTACVVEGIAKLISRNPKTDRDLLHKKTVGARSRIQLPKDPSPLRELYLGNKDDELYHRIMTFFIAAKKHLWASATQRSYIRKTVGIQALFDIFRFSMEKFGANASSSDLDSILSACSKVDFSDPAYQASGRGRVLIKNTILLYADMISTEELPEADRKLYLDLLKKFPKSRNGT